jgi:hypothetical protein
VTLRVLLLEFVVTDRQQQKRSDGLPYVQGRCHAVGAPVRWLAFGVARPEPPGNPFLMTLSPADSAVLVHAIREFQPTLILHNEEFDGTLSRVVRAAAGRASLVFLHESVLALATATTAQLDRLLARGVKPVNPLRALSLLRTTLGSSALAVDVVESDYACELANEAARHVKPYIPLWVGPLCYYRKSLHSNPAFAGVALRGAAPGGCSFCGEGTIEPRTQPRVGPIDLAFREIQRSRASCPPERFSGTFICRSGLPFLRLDELYERLLAEQVPPTILLFSARLDEFLRKAPVLQALLPRLRAAGHVVGIYNMGVENFSDVENQRFNKGITRADVERAIDLIRELERTYPKTFLFHELGGFSFILFTPWTTLEDLRINMDGARRVGLPHFHFFFSSRLQLRPGRAITELARRDRLLVEGLRDAGATGGDTVCLQSASDVELPWRFRDAQVHAIFQIAHALRHDLDGVEEPVRERLRGRGRDRYTPGELVPRLVELAIAEPSLREPLALLTALEALTPPRAAHRG